MKYDMCCDLFNPDQISVWHFIHYISVSLCLKPLVYHSVSKAFDFLPQICHLDHVDMTSVLVRLVVSDILTCKEFHSQQV